MHRAESNSRKNAEPPGGERHQGTFRFFRCLLRTEGSTFSGFTLLELMVVIAILGALSAISIPMYIGYVQKARLTKCMSDIYYLEKLLKVYQHEMGRLPDSLSEIGQENMLDPWNNPYQYLKIQGTKFVDEEVKTTGQNKTTTAQDDKGKPRKDRFLHPINNDFDLFSKGPDGKSVAPLTAKPSQDDIIRASDGRYVGQAANY